MKELIFCQKSILATLCFLFGIFSSYQTLYAQCPTEDLELETQEQVDAFIIVYPNCTEITNNVFIKRFWTNITDINNLDALQNITSITGHLHIANSPLLSTLEPLNNLVAVEELTVENCDLLTDLSGLENITSISKITIEANELLENINAFSNITNVSDSIEISSNPSLTDINGFGNLVTLNSMILNDNDQITNIDVLSDFDSFDRLELSRNEQLTNIDLDAATSAFVVERIVKM